MPTYPRVLQQARTVDPTATYASFDDEDRRFRQRSGVLPAPVIASRPLHFTFTITDAGRATRLQHKLVQGGNDLRLVYTNRYSSDASGDAADSTIVPIKVRASIEYPAGTFYAAHFPGEDANRDITIQPGGMAISDPIPVIIPVGTAFWSNTLIVPTSAGAYPISDATIRNGGPEACVVGTTDYTTSSNPGSGSGQFAYGPIAVIGTPASATARRTTRTLAVISDSFVSPGTGDSYIGNVDEKGWAARAYSGNIGWLSVAKGGEQLRQGWPVATTPSRSRYKMTLVAACDWVMDGLGTNDFYSNTWNYATFVTAKIALWNAIDQRGVKVATHTIAPRTTSTDSWATTANQTAYNSNFGPETSQSVPLSMRQTYNAWLRDGAPILSGAAAVTGSSAAGTLRVGDTGHPVRRVFDLAAVVEVWEPTTLTWAWKVGHTTDGIHPTQTAATAIAAAENVAAYT